MNTKLISMMAVLAVATRFAQAQTAPVLPQVQPTAEEKTVVDISKQKWLWMAERNLEALDKLFDDKAVFIHMSRTMTKPQELEVIKSGNIEYRKADIQETSVATIGDTVIVLSIIELYAIVRGNEARNPFTVTEAYVKQKGEWKLAALAFSVRRPPS